MRNLDTPLPPLKASRREGHPSNLHGRKVGLLSANESIRKQVHCTVKSGICTTGDGGGRVSIDLATGLFYKQEVKTNEFPL